MRKRNIDRLNKYRGFPYQYRKHKDESQKTYHIYTPDGRLLFCHDRTAAEAQRRIDHLVLAQVEIDNLKR